VNALNVTKSYTLQGNTRRTMRFSVNRVPCEPNSLHSLASRNYLQGAAASSLRSTAILINSK